MVPVPTGEFLMGATRGDKFATLLERPRHAVRLERPFALSAAPVTFEQWDLYSDATGAYRPADGGFGRGQLPVVNVSWTDAVGFCRWLAAETGRPYRLPSEAEWEYACRAGSEEVFATGDGLTLAGANFLYDETGRPVGTGRPSPVGDYPPNAFGLLDMHGNVNELVADHWHDGYSGAPADGSPWTDPPEASNRLRVLRGGSWDYLPRLLRSAHRDWIDEATRLDNVGFRVALDL
jgi:formylglycine-generating enzyme required for sulfatase activity